MRRSKWLGVLGLLGLATPVLAQLPPNLPYDGRPVLARVRFPVLGDPPGCLDPDGAGDGGWSHDYPMSIQGLMKAASEVTSIRPPVDSFVTIMSVTDPMFMKYPLAMVTEAGCWDPTDAEVKALRMYMKRGGFLVLDDLVFSDGVPVHLKLAVDRVEAWMKRVLPDGKLVPVPASDPIFNDFFQIRPTDVPGIGATAKRGAAIYGIYEDNNPRKRLMAIATYRGLLGHHWRWIGGVGSGLGDDNTTSGKAYRLGLNILVYGLLY